MIALTLSLVLVVAFLGALRNCRTLFGTLESVARLQDARRHALAVLVPDVEHAGFYGFAARGDASFVRSGATLASGAALREPAPGAPAVGVAGLPSGAHDCGVNFAVHLERTVDAADGGFRAGIDARECAPTAAADGARPGSDTLVVRHAAFATAGAHAGRIQVYSQRLRSQSPLTLFADGRAPGAVDPDREVRDLEVRLYYVANSSVERRGWP